MAWSLACRRRYRRATHLRYVRCAIFGLLCGSAFVLALLPAGSLDEKHGVDFGGGFLSRRLLADLSSTETPPTNGTNDTTNGTGHTPCVHPGVKEFIRDVFGQRLRSQGLVVLHILVVLYMFLALAIVCDEYFVASLDHICEKLGFSEDVAGATFMAAGSSAPELFTSFIGSFYALFTELSAPGQRCVFIAKGDVGVGTIVGSAVFNILFVIGLCGLCVVSAVTLTWWPMVRDSSFYLLSVVALIVSIRDGEISILESVLMLLLYVIYIIIMKFNPSIQTWVYARFGKGRHQSDGAEPVAADPNGATAIDPEAQPLTHANGNNSVRGAVAATNSHQLPVVVVANNNTQGVSSVAADVEPVSEPREPQPELQQQQQQQQQQQAAESRESSASPLQSGTVSPLANESNTNIMVDEVLANDDARKLDFPSAALRVMLKDEFRPNVRFRAAARVVIVEGRSMKRDSSFVKRQRLKMMLSMGNSQDSYLSAIRKSISMLENIDEAVSESWRAPPRGKGAVRWLRYLFELPIRILLYFTIPDCRMERWGRFYMLTFFFSILWIAVFSYIMVWMVSVIGYTIGVPDSLMGITFLAAGTSVPDAIASLIVARQGLGDMAVSNTIGSNVFDILIGLALPWFVKVTMFSPGSTVHINSRGMVYSVMLLFGSVVATLGAVHVNGWLLNKRLGVFCMVIYLITVVLCSLIEFNVFGYVNDPTCALGGDW